MVSFCFCDTTQTATPAAAELQSSAPSPSPVGINSYKKIIGKYEYQIELIEQVKNKFNAKDESEFTDWQVIYPACMIQTSDKEAKIEVAMAQRVEPQVIAGKVPDNAEILWQLVEPLGARRSVCCAVKCKGPRQSHANLAYAVNWQNARIKIKNRDTEEVDSAVVKFAKLKFACRCEIQNQNDFSFQKYHERTAWDCPVPETTIPFCCNKHDRDLYLCPEPESWAKYGLMHPKVARLREEIKNLKVSLKKKEDEFAGPDAPTFEDGVWELLRQINELKAKIKEKEEEIRKIEEENDV